MLVRKFGGTSMGSEESLRDVLKILKHHHGQQVVVVSAMSGVTDTLLEATRAAIAGRRSKVKKKLADLLARHVKTIEATVRNEQIRIETINYFKRVLDGLSGFLKAIEELGELSTRSRNTIMAVGERLSSKMLAGILTDSGLPAEQLDLEKAVPQKFKKADHDFYVATEKIFGQKVKKILAKKKIPVATGYFGWVPGGMLDSIGRGYSDYCAALIAAGARAERLEIWTDVSGILTADPRKIKKAKIIDQISSEAAAELAHFGAKVIHPQSIHPAIRAKVPVWIKNTFRPKDRGTAIFHEIKQPKQIMTSITSKKGVTIINIASFRMLRQYGFLAKIFDVFAKYETSIDVVSTSEVSVSVTIENDSKLKEIVGELSPVAKISIHSKKAIVCLVGMGIYKRRGVAGEIFATLGRAGISIDQISQGASEINITFVVDEKDADRAVSILHKKFFENGMQ
ncbi:aspartate kinase [Patescibacteria group bacterium]|nr:aspartate kinase [Patescibacteria group bacterium]